MYCQNCGKQLPDGVTACPDCTAAEAPQVEAVPVSQPDSSQNKKPLFKTPGKGSKSYAALFTALLVFPSTICIAIDVAFDRYDYWFGYVVGALLVTWVIAVLPVLRITPPVVTSLICFGSIVLYLYYIAHKSGHMGWLSNFFLPLTILMAAFIAIDSALIGSKKITGLHIFSLLSGEAAIYLIASEIMWDIWRKGEVDLKWSLIAACGFVSVVAVLEAFSYIGRVNKK